MRVFCAVKITQFDAALRERGEKGGYKPLLAAFRGNSVPLWSAENGRGAMPKIFISYRREDSFRLAQELRAAVAALTDDPQHVMSSDLAEAMSGADYAERVNGLVTDCSVLFVLIGTGWLHQRGSRGQRCLDEADDPVRLEIAAALDCSVPIVPVLLGDATLPAPALLPPDIVCLARWKPFLIDVGTLQSDVMQMLSNLRLDKADALAAMRPAKALAPPFVERVLVGHSGEAFSAAFSPDQTRILTASLDGTCRIWDWATGAFLAEFGAHAGGVVSAAYSPDGLNVVSASRDGVVKIWNAISGNQLLELREPDCLNDVSFSPDGKRIVTACEDKTASIWDIVQGHRIVRLSGHSSDVTSADFSPDGMRVVTSSDDKDARIWEAESGRCLAILCGHRSRVGRARYSRDGRFIVTAASDDSARIWSAETGEQLSVLLGHEESLVSATFSADGEMVVTTSIDGTARISRVAGGHLLAELPGHLGVVWHGNFSSDGKHVVTAAGDKLVRVWRIEE